MQTLLNGKQLAWLQVLLAAEMDKVNALHRRPKGRFGCLVDNDANATKYQLAERRYTRALWALTRRVGTLFAIRPGEALPPYPQEIWDQHYIRSGQRLKPYRYLKSVTRFNGAYRRPRKP